MDPENQHQSTTRLLRTIVSVLLLTMSIAVAIAVAPAGAAASDIGRSLDSIDRDLAVQCGPSGELSDQNCVPRCKDGPRRDCHSDDTCPDGTVLVEGECLVYCPNLPHEVDDCYQIPGQCHPNFELLDDGLCHPKCQPGTTRVGIDCVRFVCPTPQSCVLFDSILLAVEMPGRR